MPNGEAGNMDIETQVASLSQKQISFEQSVTSSFSDIKQTLGSLSAKIEERSKTPWGVFFSGLSVVGIGLGSYMSLQIAPLRDAILAQGQEQRAFLRKEDYVSISASMGARRDEFQSMIKEAVKDVSVRVDKLTDTQVTRQEHMKQWDNEKDRTADMQRQIDDLRARLNNIYSVSDVIKEDHTAIRELLGQRK